MHEIASLMACGVIGISSLMPVISSTLSIRELVTFSNINGSEIAEIVIKSVPSIEVDDLPLVEEPTREVEIAENQPPTPAISPSDVLPDIEPTLEQRELEKSFEAVDDPPIRVRIATNQIEIAVSGSDGIITDEKGKELIEVPSDFNYQVRPGETGLIIADQELPNGFWIIPNDGMVKINQQSYRGRVQVIWDGSRLIAVNEVPIEAYLYSVVGAEMYSTWHIEALKAQAIAARSYAVAHLEKPASPYFDIGNDERWQCYRGTETETESIRAAVDSTKGLIVMKGERVFLAQYAATDEISSEAHGGIGKSMSQTGAQKLAMNYSYRNGEILNHYYPGTHLGQLIGK